MSAAERRNKEQAPLARFTCLRTAGTCFVDIENFTDAQLIFFSSLLSAATWFECFPMLRLHLYNLGVQDSVNRVTEQKYCIIGQQPSSAFDFSDSPGGTLEIEHILLYCGSE